MLINQCSPALANLVLVAKEINANTIAMQNDALTKSKQDTNICSILILVLLAISIVFSVLIGTRTTKSVVEPVKEVEYAAKQLSQGILETQIPYQSGDELGSMAESMRSSLHTIKIYIEYIDQVMHYFAEGNFVLPEPKIPFIGDFNSIEQNIRRFTRKISEMLTSIHLVSEQVSSGSEQVSGSSQILSDGVVDQASSIQELSASTSEISEHVNKNAKNAQTAKAHSEETKNKVNDGNYQMQEIISAMNDINQKSNEIHNIIKTIEDIAFQTNILALNASLEAARAGALGKGFTVVAEAVRDLAAKSAEAAKTTALLIEETLQSVENGTTIANQAAATMTSIVEHTNSVTHFILDIAAATDQQAFSLSQLKLGVEQIEGVVQTNASTATESSAASEELSNQARLLKDMVSNFKTQT